MQCKLLDITSIADSWSAADQQVMCEVTEGEDFFMDLLEGPGNLIIFAIS